MFNFNGDFFGGGETIFFLPFWGETADLLLSHFKNSNI